MKENYKKVGDIETQIRQLSYVNGDKKQSS